MNPVHERLAADHIRKRHPNLVVSISSDVDPAFREYERTVVTAFDAYVKSGLDRYLAEMESDLRKAGVPATLQIMQSRGGVCSAQIARQRPIRLFLSGPAAGVVGAQDVGRSVAQDNLITVDIGGTSSDIALIAKGRPVMRPEGLLDGYRIRVPMVDVNSIGAGGGSIAWIDAGGGLRVGPPVRRCRTGARVLWAWRDRCHRHRCLHRPRAARPRVLRRRHPEARSGPRRARRGREGRPAPRPLAAEAALGIHRVVNVQMAEGIRLVSISRGIDPRGYALVPFGGGGALHATALARELGMEAIIVPRYPGVLCASGLLSAMTEHEAAGAFVRKLAEADPAEIVRICAELAHECAARMKEEGVPPEQVETLCFADICYVGQAHHIEVPLAMDDPSALIDLAYERFCALHDQVYGHHTRSPGAVRELAGRAACLEPGAAARPKSGPRAEAMKGDAPHPLEGAREFVAAAVWDRDGLAPGQIVRGPAIIEQTDTTTLVEPGWQALVAPNEVLLMTRTA